MEEEENIEYNKTVQKLWADVFRINNVVAKTCEKFNELTNEYSYHKSNYNQPEVEKCSEEIEYLAQKIYVLINRLREMDSQIIRLNKNFKFN